MKKNNTDRLLLFITIALAVVLDICFVFITGDPWTAIPFTTGLVIGFTVCYKLRLFNTLRQEIKNLEEAKTQSSNKKLGGVKIDG